MQGTSAFPWGNDVLRDFQFGCTGGSRADASGSHRTGRKEKPHQDNGKKPKCAKFYRNHFWRCERKAIKGCTARMVPNHSAFRKRNALLMHESEYAVERVVLNALATGMGLRSLIVCAFGELALPSVRAGLAFSGDADPPGNDVA